MDKTEAERIVDEAIAAYMDGPLDIKQASVPAPEGIVLFDVTVNRPFFWATGHLGYVKASQGDPWTELLNAQLYELRVEGTASLGDRSLPLVGDGADIVRDLMAGRESDEGEAAINLSVTLVPIDVQTDEKVPLTVAGIISTWAIEDGGERAEAARIVLMGSKPPAELFKQDTIPVRHQLMPTSKVLGIIPSGGWELYDEVGLIVDLASDEEKDKAKEVSVAISIDIEQTGAEISRELSEFDIGTHNALLSLWNAGNRVFTYQQVWRAITESEKRITDQQLAKTIDSCDILRRAFVRLDWTEQARARGYDVEHAKVNDFMISAREIDIELTNGSTAKGLVMLASPLFYDYSKATGENEIASVPQRMLNTDEVGTNSTEHIVIKRYLLQRIAGLKNYKEKAEKRTRRRRGKASETAEDDTRFKRIKYETICKRAGIDPANRVAKKKAIDYAIECLKLWQGRGFISGYEEVRHGTGARAARVAVDISV